MYVYMNLYLQKYPYNYETFFQVHLTTKERPSDSAQFLSNIQGLQPPGYNLDQFRQVPQTHGAWFHPVVHPLQPLPLIVGREKVTQTEVNYVERYQFQWLYTTLQNLLKDQHLQLYSCCHSMNR